MGGWMDPEPYGEIRIRIEDTCMCRTMILYALEPMFLLKYRLSYCVAKMLRQNTVQLQMNTVILYKFFFTSHSTAIKNMNQI